MFIYDINRREIKKYNVFDHYRFDREVDELLHKTNLSKEEFQDKLRSALMYYFWSKAEYEVVIYPWCGGGEKESKKIDVYTQIMMNWDKFVEYVWGFRKK